MNVSVNNLISNIPTLNTNSTTVDRSELRRVDQGSYVQGAASEKVKPQNFNTSNELDIVVSIEGNDDVQTSPDRGANLDILV